MEWISTKDRLPSTTEDVLVILNNKIAVGSFNFIESYTEHTKDNPEKSITFYQTVQFNKRPCDNCMSDTKEGKCGHKEDMCVSCCDFQNDASYLFLGFDPELVSYWMPLPNVPKSKIE